MKKSWLIWAAVGLIGGGVLAWMRAPAADAPPVTTRQTDGTATTTSAPVEEAGTALAEQCRQMAAVLETQLDPTFSVLVEPPFVMAGNMRKTDLTAHREQSVVRPAAAMWRTYFTRRPDEPITVLLLTDRGVRPPADDRDPGYAYRAWARKLFGDQPVSGCGYYKPDRRTMVVNIDTGGGTLVHELTHALIPYDFPHAPDWINEALASLHEQCRVEEDGIVGLPNWRLRDLQKALATGTLRPLADLVTKDDFRENQPGLNYAQARYFAMYLQHRGKLRDFYCYYRDHGTGERAAVAAIEHVFGESIDDVERSFLAWVNTLQFE